MHIVVHHHVVDPDKFWEIIARGDSPPPGVTLHSMLPARGGDSVFCHWEAESVATIQPLLDAGFGDAARNEYFEIDPTHAIGLPGASGTTASEQVRDVGR